MALLAHIARKHCAFIVMSMLGCPPVLSEAECVGPHAAMEAEAQPLVERLALSRDEPSRIPPPAPCVTFSGTCFGISVHLVCNGARAAACPPPAACCSLSSTHSKHCARPSAARFSRPTVARRFTAARTWRWLAQALGVGARGRQVRGARRRQRGHSARGPDGLPRAAGAPSSPTLPVTSCLCPELQRRFAVLAACCTLHAP